MNFTTLFTSLLIMAGIAWVVLMAARLFANAIAQENLRADEVWEAELKAKRDNERIAADNL